VPEQPPPHASACPQCQSRRTDTSADFPPHGDTVRETFDVLYRHWFPVVVRWARRRCADPEDAEDVAQQVFADAWLHSRRYCQQRGGLGPWLYGITAHKAADATNASIRRNEASRKLAARATRHSPDAWAGSVERLRLTPFLSCLSDRRREILFLAYYLDFTQPEIARFLGLPLGTVKSHCRRALRALAEMVPGGDTT